MCYYLNVHFQGQRVKKREHRYIVYRALHFNTNTPIATTKVAVRRSQPILNSSRLKYRSPEDESSKLLRIFGNYLTIDTASYSRTLGIFINADVRTSNLASYVNNIFGQRI